MQHDFNKEIKNIIINNKPDKEIEIFWIGFKQSIINFNAIYKINIPIELWSTILNWYQSKRDYNNIKKNIHIFISYYCIYIFNNVNSYHTSILWTNVKRWGKISDEYIFDKDAPYYFGVYHLFIDVFRVILLHDKDFTEIFDFYKKISEDIKEDDIFTLIDLSIKYKLGNIIDKINTYKNINKYIEEKYLIIIPKKMSGKKILKKIFLR
jgi:hypothetical protein